MNNPKKSAEAETNKLTDVVYTKTEDFVARYANYSFLESSLWDLKISFAQSDPRSAPELPFNSAITLPWPQAKVLWYFLHVHLAGYEAANGRIVIPAGIIQPVPESASFHNVYEDFIRANPESARKEEA